MTDDVTRTGRGVLSPDPKPAPPRRRREVALLLGAGAAIGVVLVAVLLLLKGPLFGGSDAVQQVPMPSVSGRDLKALDVPATCAALVPVATDSANAVRALADRPDGSTVDWSLVQKTHDELNLIAEVAAPELRDDITQQAALLGQLLVMKRTGNNMTLNLEDFRASGLRIGLRCKPYAVG